MASKILAVDDSRTIRTIVKKALQPYDCELFEAENGFEGLAITVREKPNLIVLDITMPVMNGIEMLEKLKDEPSLKDIPVIMLTAESSKNNVMQVLKMGVEDYMVKPFKGEELIERASKLIKLEPKKAEIPTHDLHIKYSLLDDDIQFLGLPKAVNKEIIARVSNLLTYEMTKTASMGKNKLIFDLSKLSNTSMSLIKLILLAVEKCQESKVRLRVVVNSKMSDELKGFQETAELQVYPTVEEAEAAFYVL